MFAYVVAMVTVEEGLVMLLIPNRAVPAGDLERKKWECESGAKSTRAVIQTRYVPADGNVMTVQKFCAAAVSGTLVMLIACVFAYVSNCEFQLARPEASEVSTFPAAGEPPVIFICPAISRAVPGLEVHIPTFPPVNARLPPERIHRELRSAISARTFFISALVNVFHASASLNEMSVYAAWPTPRTMTAQKNAIAERRGPLIGFGSKWRRWCCMRTGNYSVNNWLDDIFTHLEQYENFV